MNRETGLKTLSEKRKPKASRLGNRIPSVRKETFERFRTATPKKWAKHTKTLLWESVHRTNMDTDLGELATLQDKYKVTEEFEIVGTQRIDVRRDPVKNIPLHFSNKELSLEDTSFDLFGSELLNYFSSKNFYEKMKIMPEVNLTAFLMKQRKTRRSESGIAKLMKLNNRNKKEAAHLKPEEMKNLKALQNFYDQFMFGEELKEAKTFLYGKGVDINLVKGKLEVTDTLKEVSLNKISNMAIQWWALVALGLNWVSAIANYIQGTSQSIVLDVHDVGSFESPMKEGMVFTC